MAIKKSQLYSSLWQSCDELRGGMDVSQYKDYVLTLLFMKYVSDKYAGKKNGVIEVPEGGSFAAAESRLVTQNNKAGRAVKETLPEQDAGQTRDKVAEAAGIGLGRPVKLQTSKHWRELDALPNSESVRFR
jgi:type I restriction-modification system DNA methylase subunit